MNEPSPSQVIKALRGGRGEMTISGVIRLVRAILPKGTKLTPQEARAVCASIRGDELSYPESGWRFIDFTAADPLRRAFKGYPFRVAEDRTGEYKYTFVTYLKDDPREHVGDAVRNGGYCIHCSKVHKAKAKRSAT
jgi:hypothetical protein